MAKSSFRRGSSVRLKETLNSNDAGLLVFVKAGTIFKVQKSEKIDSVVFIYATNSEDSFGIRVPSEYLESA